MFKSLILGIWNITLWIAKAIGFLALLGLAGILLTVMYFAMW